MKAVAFTFHSNAGLLNLIQWISVVYISPTCCSCQMMYLLKRVKGVISLHIRTFIKKKKKKKKIFFIFGISLGYVHCLHGSLTLHVT